MDTEQVIRAFKMVGIFILLIIAMRTVVQVVEIATRQQPPAQGVAWSQGTTENR